MGVKVAGAKPLPARQRLLIRIDQAKQHFTAAERLLTSTADRAALRELEFTRALIVGACTELAGLIPAPEPATVHPRHARTQPPPDGE